jgi:hypothetical protein
VVLGTEVHEHQYPSPGQRFDLVLDKRLAPAVEPVKILEHEQGRLAPAVGMGETL